MYMNNFILLGLIGILLLSGCVSSEPQFTSNGFTDSNGNHYDLKAGPTFCGPESCIKIIIVKDNMNYMYYEYDKILDQTCRKGLNDGYLMKESCVEGNKLEEYHE